MKLLPKFLSLWHISVCLYVCVFVCICVCLSRKMTTVLLCTFFVCLAALWRIWHFRSICLLALHLTSAKLNRSGGLTLCLSVTPSLCLSAYLSVWLSIRLSVGPSIPLPVCNCDCTRCACKVVLHFISFQSTCISVTSTRPFFGGGYHPWPALHLCKLDIWFVFSEHTSTHVPPWALFGPNPACQRQDAPLSQKLTCYNRLRDMTPIPVPTPSLDFDLPLGPLWLIRMFRFLLDVCVYIEFSMSPKLTSVESSAFDISHFPSSTLIYWLLRCITERYLCIFVRLIESIGT